MAKLCPGPGKSFCLYDVRDDEVLGGMDFVYPAGGELADCGPATHNKRRTGNLKRQAGTILAAMSVGAWLVCAAGGKGDPTQRPTVSQANRICLPKQGLAFPLPPELP